MRISELFTKTLKEDPHDEVSVNAMLLSRGGFLYKNSSGIFSLLPLGWRVLSKINAIIREEMDAVGGQELIMPSLIEKRYWERTGRWDLDVSFKIESENGEFALGWTHEEVVTDIATKHINSYKDLPKAVYQIQTKFRNEPRARSGLLRGREFLMKDLYSFHADKKDLEVFYKKMMKAYDKILKRCGVGGVWAEAEGGEFTEEVTHELQVLVPSGEDTVYICEKCGYAKNKELMKSDTVQCKKCKKEMKEERGIEVGNVFKLGTRFSEAFKLTYRDTRGVVHPIVMGSYGIGPTRLLATLVEVFHDSRGILWPEPVAPYHTYLMGVEGSSKVKKAVEAQYKKMIADGEEVLFDDRWELSAGEKFANADLLGMPQRMVISERLLEENKIEIKQRNKAKPMLVKM